MPSRGPLVFLIGASLRHRVAVVAAVVVFCAFGLVRLSNQNFDVFPDFAPPQATIQTEAPGFSAEQVETLVSRPLELAITGLPGLVSIRSNSIQGLSVIMVVFRADADIYRLRQQVTEALAGTSKELPDGVREPRLAPLTSSTGVVLIAGLSSKTVSPTELRTMADWVVRPRLLSVPGVAKINVYGGDVRQLQIQINPTRLLAFDISLDDVAAAARKALGLRGTGFIDSPNQRIVLEEQTTTAPLARLQGAIVATHNGQRLRIKDVANVTEGAEPAIGTALIDGKAGVQLVVSAQYGANTVRVAHAVTRALREQRPELATAGIEVRDDLFRPAEFIETALGNLGHALLLGGFLVVAVVALFLWNIRMALVALTAIPLSLVAAAAVMQAMGFSLNTMTLGGLGIAVGLLVDDAVIVVENVHRRLGQVTGATAPDQLIDAVTSATYEVRSAVVYATLALALLFLPVLFIEDVAGRLFGPLGVAYVVATLASLVTAVTVTPALCLLLMSRGSHPKTEPWLATLIKERYRTILRFVERRFTIAATLTLGLCLGTASLVNTFGASFIPELKEGHYVALMSLAPGSSIRQSVEVGQLVASRLLVVPHVRTVAQRTGRAEQADDVFGTNYSEIDIDLEPTDGAGQGDAEAGIRKVLEAIPGATFSVRPFLTDRLDEVISGYMAPVVIRMMGTDLDSLDVAANQIRTAVQAIGDARDVQIQNPSGVPTLAIELKDAALLRWGLNPIEVLDAIHTAYQGSEVGQVYIQDRVFNAALIAEESWRHQPENIAEFIIKTPGGAFVRLGELASFHMQDGRYGVLHEQTRRVQVVTAGTNNEHLGAFMEQVRGAIKTLALPEGVRITVAGSADAQSQSGKRLLLDVCIAVIGMLVLLSLIMPSWRNLSLVVLNLPFAMTGGVIALAIVGGNASLGALVGFVTLFGISLRNAIMMLSHFEHLVSNERLTWSHEVAIQGASERLVPILMTTLATALGLLPLALGSGEPGRELEGPMAVVILGGLASSALLNLLLLPALASRWGRFGQAIDTSQGAPVAAAP